MKIVVLIKQVPDATEVKLDPKTGSLLREGVSAIINPDDRHALEAAIRLKEETESKITVLSMGPAQAIDAISEAIGMGADEGILLSDRAFAGADTWATSTTLGKALDKIGAFDLVIAGRQAIDGDTAQIGPQVAEYLQVSSATYVFEIEGIEKGAIVVKRRVEDGFERIRCILPALITVIGEMNRPRYPHMAKLIDACQDNAPITVWNAADIGVQNREVGLEGSLTHVIKTFSPKSQRQAILFDGDAKTSAESLVGKMRENLLV